MPLAFVRGVIGQFFQSLSLALSISLLVSMVVSLTIIPVLASRYLARRPMPTTGPIYEMAAQRLRGDAEIRPPLSASRRARGHLMIFPAWFLFNHVKTGFMPDMDEGAFVVDYFMPVGTSLAETDKVVRRVETILQKTPDVAGYIRRTGAELGLLRDRVVPRRHSGQPQAEPTNGGRCRKFLRTWKNKSKPRSRNSSRSSSSRWCATKSTIFRALISRSKSKSSAPTSTCAGTGRTGRQNCRKDAGTQRSQLERGTRQSRYRGAHQQRKAARIGLTDQDVEMQLNAALYGQVAATIPEQDRMTKIRVRYPDQVRYNREGLGKLPISFIATRRLDGHWDARGVERNVRSGCGGCQFRASGRSGHGHGQARRE